MVAELSIYKWKNKKGRIDSLLLWVSRLSARQTEPVSPIARYIALYSLVSNTVKRKNQYKDFLHTHTHTHIYIYIYIYTYIYIYIERLFSYKRYTILLIKSEVLTCDLHRRRFHYFKRFLPHQEKLLNRRHWMLNFCVIVISLYSHLLILTYGISTNLVRNIISWWAISTKWSLGVTMCSYD